VDQSLATKSKCDLSRSTKQENTFFHFRGIPDEDMSLLLYAEGKSNENREELTHFDTTLDALLVDQTATLSAQARECRETVKMKHIGRDVRHGGGVLALELCAHAPETFRLVHSYAAC